MAVNEGVYKLNDLNFAQNNVSCSMNIALQPRWMRTYNQKLTLL